MGVDAQILLKFNYDPTDQQLRELQYNLMHRFGKGMFISTDYKTKENKMFLIRCNEFYQDGDTITPKENETLVEVMLWGRYYGEGYERGDGLKISAMLLYLSQQPNIEVWYGGDSSGITAQQYDQNRALNLLNYFLINGNFPYDQYFTRDEENSAPLCSYCQIPMNRFGFGQSYAAFNCLGCNEQKIARDESYAKWASGDLQAPEVSKIDQFK